MRYVLAAVTLAAVAAGVQAQEAAPLSSQPDVARLQGTARASIAASQKCSAAIADQAPAKPAVCHAALDAFEVYIAAQTLVREAARRSASDDILDEMTRTTALDEGTRAIELYYKTEGS